jgi:hypothetical protein
VEDSKEITGDKFPELMRIILFSELKDSLWIEQNFKKIPISNYEILEHEEMTLRKKVSARYVN